MATNYSVQISMLQDTVTALQQGSYQMYGFKGVQTTQGGGVPVVWFATPTFSLATLVSWSEQYQAFTSLSAVVPNGQIVATAAYDTDLAQVLNVTNPAGVGEVVNGGTVGAISINNQTTTQMTCGISEMVNGVSSPLCAFPLYGLSQDIMAPIETVLLMFSTLPVDTGTVIYQALSQGILITFPVGTTGLSVKYDINTGWSWGDGAWAETVPPNAELVPLLITSSTELENNVLLGMSQRTTSRRR